MRGGLAVATTRVRCAGRAAGPLSAAPALLPAARGPPLRLVSSVVPDAFGPGIVALTGSFAIVMSGTVVPSVTGRLVRRRVTVGFRLVAGRFRLVPLRPVRVLRIRA
ncbi:hypothetical protein ASE41_35610 [Streptomyces sp. Root264]|nr:hypothetical protein ASE41_35610 [Streptomyces sp. Root264]